MVLQPTHLSLVPPNILVTLATAGFCHCQHYEQASATFIVQQQQQQKIRFRGITSLSRGLSGFTIFGVPEKVSEI